MEYKRYTLAERPELRPQLFDIEQAVWLPFMTQSPVANENWGKLINIFPEYQTVFVNDEGKVIAGGVTIPFVWDGTLETLPDGWEAVILQGIREHEDGLIPNAMSALEAVIDPAYQGQGLSTQVIGAMRDIAKSKGYRWLVAPVRPTVKPLYPLTPIERYAAWTQSDGLPFDPWMRVHARLGAEVIAMSPHSMYIPGSVSDWETWTGLVFPESGKYVVQGACQPVTIDVEADLGVYYDPNVWMRHEVGTGRET
ncbi:MAG: GNAT family N-acetyltransferase [Chloroflexota bacterium]